MNTERALRAKRALAYYKVNCLKEAGTVSEDDITDLLTDLLHLAHKHNFASVSSVLMPRARNNFNAELMSKD